MEKVTVVVNPKTGEVSYEVEGVMGGQCKDITDLLIQGQEVVEHQLTSEYQEFEEMPDYVSDLG